MLFVLVINMEVVPEPITVSDRIKAFLEDPQWPEHIKDPQLKQMKRRSSSILTENGVRIVDGDGCEWFLCLLGQCSEKSKPVWIKCSKNASSNATEHLKTQHCIVSSKTISQQQTIHQLSKQIDLSRNSFKADPLRWFKVQISAWAAEQSLSYRAFETQRWRLIASQLPVGLGGMTSFNPRKHMVELYETLKQGIVEEINLAKQQFHIPFMSLNLDLYQNKFNNMKFLALRLSWLRRSSSHSYNLAIRRYAPTIEERNNHQASDNLFSWARGVLREFDIELSAHVLTGNSDSGSDVKRCIEVVMALMREWCISHLCHLSLVDAFGTHLDPAKCKNKDAQKVFADVRSVVETINKSEALKDIVDAFTKDEFGYFIKQKNAPGHRWSSNAIVLERLIGAHSPIVSAFRQQQRICKVAEHKNILIEFYSVIVPVREIQTMAQSMNTFVVIDVYVMMLLTVLDPMSPLLIRNPTPIPFGTPPRPPPEGGAHPDHDQF